MLDSINQSLAFPAPLRPEIELLETSGIAQVFELGLGRDDIVRLWVGEGDLPTPDLIGEAAIQALREGKTFYNRKRGIIELCEALVRYTNELYGVSIDSERVTVSSSGMTGILLALQTMVGPGDKVVVVSPVWPNITAAVKIAGGIVEEIVLDRLPRAASGSTWNASWPPATTRPGRSSSTRRATRAAGSWSGKTSRRCSTSAASAGSG